MKEFLLVFRRDADQSAIPFNPEQLQEMMTKWQDWMGSLAAQNRVVNPGKRLDADGRVVRGGNTVTNGPYVELKEVIGGFVLLAAKDLDEAAELAKGCPIYTVGGNVEVRPLVEM